MVKRVGRIDIAFMEVYVGGLCAILPLTQHTIVLQFKDGREKGARRGAFLIHGRPAEPVCFVSYLRQHAKVPSESIGTERLGLEYR